MSEGLGALFQSEGQGFGTGSHIARANAGALVLARPHRFPTIDRFAGADLVVDLGARIGSGEWFRGLFTCLALCTAAGMMTPTFKPLDFAPQSTISAAQRDEVRAHAIAPLALGGDTGRRLAATSFVEPLTDIPERPRIELTATVGRGDGFGRVLERAGVSRDEAKTISTLVADAVPLADIDAGTRMDLALGRRAVKTDPRPLETLAFRARFDLKLEVLRVDGRLQLKRIPIAVDHTPLRIQGQVGSSLYRSARAAGVPAGALEHFIKAISQKLSMRGIGSNARFDAIIEHARAETGEVRIGGLLFAGIIEGGKKVQMVKWSANGRDQWYEASGVGETRGVMRRPVLGQLTSGFGLRRHPILGFSRMHQGMDFGAPMGAPIVAATDGSVGFAGRHGGHGNYVRLTHAGGISTGYAHLSRIIVRRGERVRQGQLIGYVGSTGLSTGPHLHYEVFQNGRAINPASMKFTTVAQLTGRDLANFKAKLANLLGVRVANGSGAAKKTEDRAEATTKDKSADKDKKDQAKKV